jgi:lipopolysaccharide transport system ATP-binding protein
MTTIRFEQVSKKFRQHHANPPDGDLWAVRDVDFECGEGEVLGLVGRNGCGKSTLLKLAAGVTSPTSGRVTCTKQVAPMLELGAGFHPDLTGRENIKLNGSLLGLGRNLGASQLEEIVAFAGVEEHVDTPVKHYSSGMCARLGFAVAVHSPARLMLVDEVLSVGDKLFQQKCLVRMKQLRDQGTTIVLVSHDDWWIRNFCTRALVIDGGRVVTDTHPDEALQIYDLRLYPTPSNKVDGIAITHIEIADASGLHIGALRTPSLTVRIAYEVHESVADWTMIARIRRQDGIYCASCIHRPPDRRPFGVAVIHIDELPFLLGRYVVEVSIQDAASLVSLVTGVSNPLYLEGEWDERRGYTGIVKLKHRWSFE